MNSEVHPPSTESSFSKSKPTEPRPSANQSRMANLLRTMRQKATHPDQILRSLAGRPTSAKPDSMPPPTRNKFGIMQKEFDTFANKLPNPGYNTEVTTFGGKFVTLPDGKMVYDTRTNAFSTKEEAKASILNKIDQLGDIAVRTYDDHVPRDPLKIVRRNLKMAIKHPLQAPHYLKNAVDIIHPAPKRHKTPDKILKNIHRLGLDEYYGPHPLGIEVKKPEIFTKGYSLHDIMRSDIINSDLLNDIDRNQAIAEAAKYIKKLHDNYGPIGEVHTADIQFQKREANKVLEPVFNIPDVSYLPNPTSTPIAQKATDMLDFFALVASEIQRRALAEGKNPLPAMRESLTVAANNYADREVLDAVKMFVDRGRLPLSGDQSVVDIQKGKFAQMTREVSGIVHNRVRLGIGMGEDKQYVGPLRTTISEVCGEFAKQHTPASQGSRQYLASQGVALQS